MSAPVTNYDGFDIVEVLASADPAMLWTAHRLNRERVQCELAAGRARLNGDTDSEQAAEQRLAGLPLISPLQALTVARLLGTTGGYVYLYWPANGRTEVLVQENVSRIEVLPRRMPRGRSAAATTAEAP